MGLSALNLFCSSGCTNDLCDSSNNPFAVTAPSASPVPSPQPPVQPSLSNFSLPSTYDSHEPPPRHDYATPSQPAPAPSPQSTAKHSQTHTDQDHAHLANLFAARDGDGVDTFGNVGTLRYVALPFSGAWCYRLIQWLPVGSASPSMVSLPHKRRVPHHRTVSIHLHNNNSSNKHRTMSSHSSLSEGGILLGWFGGFSYLRSFPTFSFIPTFSLSISPEHPCCSLGLVCYKYHL